MEGIFLGPSIAHHSLAALMFPSRPARRIVTLLVILPHMTTVYDFSVRAKDGSVKSLSDYRGKVLVIVNVASKCGLTPQYEALQALYARYAPHGLEILAFPSNQFAGQEPGTDAEITEFCTINYGVTFPVFSKIDVNGEHEDPLYTWLKSEKKDLLVIGAIEWNFSKFLIDREGRVLDRYLPTTDPMSMEDDIREALGLPPEPSQSSI